MKRILIIEDEQKIQEILVEFLKENNYEVDTAQDGVEGLQTLKESQFDLVLLDVMLPKIDGFALLELLRKDSDIPVIIITALDDSEYEIKGFDLYADDYITKPFSMNLVIRRIEAVLRRKNTDQQTVGKIDAENMLLSHNDVVLDLNSCQVFMSGNNIPFTYKEYEIIKLMLENKNKVFTRDELLSKVWEYDYIGNENVVNNHIMRIRKKLGNEFITTVRGIGYRIDA